MKRITLYADTEFTNFDGELISLGMVSTNYTFYEVKEYTDIPNDWVKANVLPVLNREAISHIEFVKRFHQFMLMIAKEGEIDIVVDWPEDIVHIAKLLCMKGGWRLNVFPVFILVNSPELYPDIRHNALSDAIALRNAYTNEIVR